MVPRRKKSVPRTTTQRHAMQSVRKQTISTRKSNRVHPFKEVISSGIARLPSRIEQIQEKENVNERLRQDRKRVRSNSYKRKLNEWRGVAAWRIPEQTDPPKIDVYSCSDIRLYDLPCTGVLDRFWISKSFAEPALRCRT